MQQKIAKFLMITGTFTLLTACTVGPDYVRPTAVVPASYKEAAGWKAAQPKDNCIKGAWWEIFNDPRLNALEEQVNISNQNIIAAEAQFRQARALVQQTRAGYFPTVTAGASFTRTRSSVVNGTGRSSMSGISNYQLPVDVSWVPDVWGRVRRTVEASQANAQASAADLGATQLSSQGELAQDYFQLRTLDAQKQLLDSTVANYRKSLELTKSLYAQGVDSIADVLQAETQLKTPRPRRLTSVCSEHKWNTLSRCLQENRRRIFRFHLPRCLLSRLPFQQAYRPNSSSGGRISLLPSDWSLRQTHK